MRVFTFQPRFHRSVRYGFKTSTIRGKAHCKPGDELSLRAWCGRPYHSKQKRLCGKRICTAVRQVRIYARGGHGGNGMGVVVDGVMLAEENRLLALARQEGFDHWPAMAEWFRENHQIRHGKAFEGEMVEWK